jgi:hypothetical protein
MWNDTRLRPVGVNEAAIRDDEGVNIPIFPRLMRAANVFGQEQSLRIRMAWIGLSD